ncbi:SAM-dependent methyltransferase [Fulvimarina endophytica]|uniref:SAM-dependent methyltransferase n=1 Tax=Fulvimarina endophytica TaxID=2293836 RepID=A0A371X336_9HYPH|nr:SAM-dependent methyltransferase [Fulvimarina endophytica]RFC63622.1 SAM-dependent methyltransferase [Fulvimarina endophytica]
MSAVVPSNRAIVHRRVEAVDSLDYFPTPPWATRALFHHVLGQKRFLGMTVEEPACGEGHMAYALEEFFGSVRSSDIHTHGYGEVRDFLNTSAWDGIERPDWIVTNPPFGRQTLPFMQMAIARARRGVAMFVRTTQIEGRGRWRDVFRPHPPALLAQFVERVPLHSGRWEPEGGTLTAYCWIVWRIRARAPETRLVWIPPCRDELTFQRDIERFGKGPEAFR